MAVAVVPASAAAQGAPPTPPGSDAAPAPGTAPAAPTPPPAKPAPGQASAEDLENAKKLFRQGVALRKAEDYQRALDYFQRSRQLVPSVPNTMNAAFCLDRIGRNAEALELYEALLTEFGGELTDAERKEIAASMAALRPKVGSLQISANVEGKVVIDGRMRGELPMNEPVRVMPGKRLVRIMKDGFETFEAEVNVKKGETARLDAKLEALKSAGRLRVASAAQGAEVFIDGAPVGKTPWEGTLAPGRHLYFIRTDDNRGSAPALATVIAGQTILVDAEAKPLSGDLRIVIDPPTAELSINGLNVGRGTWQGRLPVGGHTLEAREEGYVPFSIEQQLAETTAGDINLELRIDEDHPRWNKDQSLVFVEAFGGVALAGSMGSRLESGCGNGYQCSQNGTAAGGMFGARGGYDFGFGLAAEAAAGYLFLSKSVVRELDSQFPDRADPTSDVGVTYALDDKLRVSGPFVSVGVAYRYDVSKKIAVDGRAHVGALFARARDPVSASAATVDQRADAEVAGAGESETSAAIFVMPSVQARYNFDDLHVALGLAVPIVLIDGPESSHGSTRVLPSAPSRCAQSSSSSGTTTSVECAPATDEFAGERLYGQFAAFVPSVVAGYTF